MVIVGQIVKWEDSLRTPRQVPLEPGVAYEQSCYVFGHTPPCPSYLVHLRRLRAEREAAGGEAQLKAQCGFWRRLGLPLEREP